MAACPTQGNPCTAWHAGPLIYVDECGTGVELPKNPVSAIQKLLQGLSLSSANADGRLPMRSFTFAPRRFRILFVGGLALVAGLIGSSLAHAQNNAKTGGTPRSANAAAKSAASAANAQAAFQEAAQIRSAISLLLKGDKDYKGHRAKAVQAAKAAVKILDGQVMTKGTGQAKSATQAQDAAVAQQNTVENSSAIVHEAQAISDAQLRQAGQILTQVRGSVAQRKQKRVLGHVDTAIKEIQIALSIK
jgi:hypothetical protein